MLHSLRNLLLGFMLCAAAGVSWYLNTPPDPSVGHTQPSASERLGYYLKDATFRGMDAEGKVAYEMVARRIEELPGTELLRLETVEIRYYDSGSAPWIATAARATVPSDRRFVDLEGTVRLASTEDDLEQRALIEAEAMRFEPEHSFATTAGSARLSVGRSWMTAMSLEANLIDDSIVARNVHAEVSR